MNDLSNTVIETERLKMIPINLNYISLIFSEFTDEITRYMYPSTPKTVDDTGKYVIKKIAEIRAGEQLPVVILNKISGEFLGCGGVEDLGTDTPELGIWIKKSAHGYGYGMEAVAGLKTWAENSLVYKYIKYPVDKDNVTSRRIAEALGGKIEKEETVTNPEGKVLHLVEYRIHR